jgi:hypothetical protein
MRVGLMIPCYVDVFYPEVGIAALELLEKLGIEVEYPFDQTYCGQPMANSGCEADARHRRVIHPQLLRIRIHRYPLGQLYTSYTEQIYCCASQSGAGSCPIPRLRSCGISSRRSQSKGISLGYISA